ncbi:MULTISPECIES: lipopolysaccharide assembly protein LapB [unclassified Ectothiorhodospira]|uniref:tetratricopeptide repeat protein n=1 Tax=unclassified Ectothiorhodospira TaxID=2684909 RepID=UPI001EE7E668|nr:MULTISPECIES: tetratricopeptide repeat protein [unclassified Ectothiorhodospira]MCG5516948.1 tetratricopeptide repeat protein [Ectothiorhodospira sp. 9100]MCG5519866.1 tetratricopeptide repeat protein [Ectothiorhodospira sp. 9905]
MPTAKIEKLHFRGASNTAAFIVGLTAYILLIYLYHLALPGYFLFDDAPNLDNLPLIDDFRTAFAFISSGDAGPLGRPLSLATFVPQAAHWPENPSAFLAINILIHGIVTLLVFSLALGLAKLRHTNNSILPLWIGLGVSILWSYSPFLATTHLMPIQRMTSLAGLFIFMGLNAFVWAHLIDPWKTRWRAILLFGGLSFCTGLAVFSKENGALLPLLTLIVWFFWLPENVRSYSIIEKWVLGALMFVPSLLVVLYLLYRLPANWNEYSASLHFTPAERLLTQPTILLEYLRNLLLPNLSSITPFTDRLPPSQGWLNPPITAISIIFWFLAFAGAFWLRRATPVLFFGLIFFFIGHLLESTWISLELFFAHRNYVPAFGVYFAVIYLLIEIGRTYPRLISVGAGLYIALFAIILSQVSTSWNDKRVIGEFWVEHNPYSERAPQFLALSYLEHGDIIAARSVISEASERLPNNATLQLQRTTICLEADERFPSLIDEVEKELSDAPFHGMAAKELFRFSSTANLKACPLLDHNELLRLSEALLQNPAYLDNPQASSLLYMAKARNLFALGHHDEAIINFKKSYNIYPNLHSAWLTTEALIGTKEWLDARQFIETVRHEAETRRDDKKTWEKNLESLERELQRSIN